MNIKLSNHILMARVAIASLRQRIDPWYRVKKIENKFARLEENLYYEMEDDHVWKPQILGTAETLKRVLERRCSLSRFGDGEFELMQGRSMSFESSNAKMATRLREILEQPTESCLVCVPNIFSSLARYRLRDRVFWRGAATWMRPILKKCLERSGNDQRELGDTQVSRPYLGIACGDRAEYIFSLWKKLFNGKRILIAEGRFSRLGIGNDLFSGAQSIARVWCPSHGAFAYFDDIYDTVLKLRSEFDLVLLALGATATILAYKLSQAGVWAVDAGHVDVEYMWMLAGVTEKCPIPNRYVNECVDGREMIKKCDEERTYNVIKKIGVS